MSNTIKYSCALPNCANVYRLNTFNKHYFSLPANENTKQKWVDVLQEHKVYFRKSLKICQDHFGRDSFFSCLRNRLLHGAVPHLFTKEEIDEARINEEKAAICRIKERLINKKNSSNDKIPSEPKHEKVLQSVNEEKTYLTEGEFHKLGIPVISKIPKQQQQQLFQKHQQPQQFQQQSQQPKHQQQLLFQEQQAQPPQKQQQQQAQPPQKQQQQQQPKQQIQVQQFQRTKYEIPINEKAKIKVIPASIQLCKNNNIAPSIQNASSNGTTKRQKNFEIPIDNELKVEVVPASIQFCQAINDKMKVVPIEQAYFIPSGPDFIYTFENEKDTSETPQSKILPKPSIDCKKNRRRRRWKSPTHIYLSEIRKTLKNIDKNLKRLIKKRQ